MLSIKSLSPTFLLLLYLLPFGFTPNSEYEFIIDGEKLYRVLSKFITIKYEYQGDEEAYNPSWA